MVEFVGTAPTETLRGAAKDGVVYFAVTFSPRTLGQFNNRYWLTGMQNTYNKISQTGYAFPVSPSSVVSGTDASTVNVRISRDGLNATVADLVNKLDALDPGTGVDKVQRITGKVAAGKDAAVVLAQTQAAAAAKAVAASPLTALENAAGKTLATLKWVAIAVALVVVVYLAWPIIRRAQKGAS